MDLYPYYMLVFVLDDADPVIPRIVVRMRSQQGLVYIDVAGEQSPVLAGNPLTTARLDRLQAAAVSIRQARGRTHRISEGTAHAVTLDSSSFTGSLPACEEGLTRIFHLHCSTSRTKRRTAC
jgi:hypothetical protein